MSKEQHDSCGNGSRQYSFAKAQERTTTQHQLMDCSTFCSFVAVFWLSGITQELDSIVCSEGSCLEIDVSLGSKPPGPLRRCGLNP